jgi:hypothetical protein
LPAADLTGAESGMACSLARTNHHILVNFIFLLLHGIRIKDASQRGMQGRIIRCSGTTPILQYRKRRREFQVGMPLTGAIEPLNYLRDMATNAALQILKGFWDTV